MLDGRVTAVETDFGAARLQDLDEAGAKPVIGLRRRTVGWVVVPSEQEEGRADAASGLQAENPLEAPVRIGPPELVERDRRQCSSLAKRRGGLPRQRVALQPSRRAPHAAPRPAPWHVDVVREGDREAGSVPLRRREAEPPAQPLERRIAEVEARRFGAKASVAVPELRRPVSLLHARQVKERIGEVVAFRPLARDRGVPTPRPGRERRRRSRRRGLRGCRAPSAHAARPWAGITGFLPASGGF